MDLVNIASAVTFVLLHIAGMCSPPSVAIVIALFSKQAFSLDHFCSVLSKGNYHRNLE